MGAGSLTAFVACGEGALGDPAGGGGGYDDPSTASAGGSTGAGVVIDAGVDAPPPPEKEVESSYGAPVATGNYVWIANPSSGRVAYIDAKSFEIKLVEAGNGPTFIAAVPDATDDVAVVLNVLSHDATVLRTGSDGAITTAQIPVPPSGNAWAVSRDGRWAIAWTDSRQVTSADPVDGYQDVTVLDLKKGSEISTPLTVGYRPVAMAFDAASQRAFAVTQDGVTVVSLLDPSGPAVVKNVALGDTMGETTRDVSITPDGSYALVRREGDASVGVFSLADGTRTDVTLPGAPTDLDLFADGSAAVAVLRESGQVALLPVPGIAQDPTSFTLVPAGAPVGSASLASKSPTALLYTNATPSSLLGVMGTTGTPSFRSILLRAPILAVFPTPDASNALVLHDALDTAGSHYAAALSVVPVALDLPSKIVGLSAPVISVAVAPAGDRALVATGSEASGSYALTVASMPSLAIQTIPLASLPIAAGIVEGAGRGFVAQKHPDGRITFVDLKTGEARTLTGFELASQVVDGTR